VIHWFVKDTSWLVEVVFLCFWLNPLHVGRVIFSRGQISLDWAKYLGGWAKFLAKRDDFSLDSHFSIGGSIS
jgi:hypothetical protein